MRSAAKTAMPLAISNKISSPTPATAATKNENWWVYWLAIAAAIGAALTETSIFVFVKTYPLESPFYAVQSLYPAGLGALLLANLS